MTAREFFKQFPDDYSCLEHLFNIRFGQGHTCPKCERASKWHRLASEMAFSCQWCGHHIHPMVGTIFAKSRTPLQMWFYAIFLYTTTRKGVAAKELQRQLGVTYKCAWRMAHAIRAQMRAVDGEAPIGGAGKTVQIDETYVGGVAKGKGRGYKGNKAIVEDGDAIAKVVPDVKSASRIPSSRSMSTTGRTSKLTSCFPTAGWAARAARTASSITRPANTSRRMAPTSMLWRTSGST